MRNVLLFFAVLAFSACTTTDDVQPLVGEWQGVSWKVAGKESGRNVQDVSFTFKEDATYISSFGQQSEAGMFYLQNGQLYTTADGAGQVEKVVGLQKVVADTLIFDMNRVGTPEELVLVRKK